jgi:thiol-disulfide isomerase/thioredoxin
MVHEKYLSFVLFILLFITSFLFNQGQETNNTKNETKSNYDYEDDEQEEDRKKGINETHIIILNDSNYSTEIKKYESLFLIFYSSPCQNCKMYMPHFIRLSHYSFDFNLGIKFAKVDGKLNDKIVKEYNIESYPTIILFYKNKLYYYNKEITSAGLLKFYEKIKNGPIRELKNLRDLEIVLKAHLRVLLSTIKDKSLTIYKSLINYSSENGRIEFVSCINDDCIEKYGKDEIIFFHEREDKINYYSKDYESIYKANINSIKTFMSIFNVEYGTYINQQYKLDMLFENENKKAIFYFRNSNNKKHTSKDILFKELGKELRLKNIYTFISDISGDDIYELVTNFFVVNENELPTILYYDLIDHDQDSNTYRLMNIKERNINKEYILKFLDNINNGKIKRDLHTSFPPKFKEKDGLRNVVGRSYDKDVIEEKKNVCILFIDGKKENEKDDIGKKYKDIMINLSEKYSDDEKLNIVFEMIDGRTNEPRDIIIKNVEDFPLIYLYTNSMKEKKIINFKPKIKDSITESEIENFILENLDYNTQNKEEDNKNDL